MVESDMWFLDHLWYISSFSLWKCTTQLLNQLFDIQMFSLLYFHHFHNASAPLNDLIGYSSHINGLWYIIYVVYEWFFHFFNHESVPHRVPALNQIWLAYKWSGEARWTTIDWLLSYKGKRKTEHVFIGHSHMNVSYTVTTMHDLWIHVPMFVCLKPISSGADR